MNDLIALSNFAIVVSGITISIICLLFSIVIKETGRINKQFFVIFFVILFFYLSSDLVSQISLSILGPDYSLLSGIAVFFESFFSSLLMPMLTIMICFYSGEKPKNNPWIITALLIWLVYFLTLIATQFTTHIYYITDDNIYRRGHMYPLLLISSVALMVFNWITLYYKRRYLTSQQFLAFNIYIIIPSVSMMLQVMFYGILMIVFGTSVAALIMFLFLVTEQIQISINRELENTEQSINIMVLQMRPHFIYNTLLSIYYLCVSSPQKTQTIIGDFLIYLRKNINAIAQKDLISFEDELEHTRAYLAVEKARFEDLLSVEYDTPYTDFCLPPLTLQPIVENAVKHNMDHDLPPLHIIIRTEHIPASGSIITIQDNGSGFYLDPLDEPDESGSTHIGVANVRKRLKVLCGGSMEVSSEINVGTTVKLTIPDK